MIKRLSSCAGEVAGSGTEWLGDVVTALLQRAQELRLATRADGGPPGGGGEGLSVTEGRAWQKCFASFFTLLHRHLQTLSNVYRLAQEVGCLPELLVRFGGWMGRVSLTLNPTLTHVSTRKAPDDGCRSGHGL
jgi:hypothetical protein